MKGRVSSSTPLFGLPEQTQKGFALGWGSCLSCTAEFNLLWLMLSVRGLVVDAAEFNLLWLMLSLRKSLMPFSAGFWLFLSHGGVVGGCLHVAAEPVCFLLGCRRSKGRSFHLLGTEQQPGRVSSLCISSSSQGAVHSADKVIPVADFKLATGDPRAAGRLGSCSSGAARSDAHASPVLPSLSGRVQRCQFDLDKTHPATALTALRQALGWLGWLCADEEEEEEDFTAGSFLSSRRLCIPVVPALSSLETAEVFKPAKTLQERGLPDITQGSTQGLVAPRVIPGRSGKAQGEEHEGFRLLTLSMTWFSPNGCYFVEYCIGYSSGRRGADVGIPTRAEVVSPRHAGTQLGYLLKNCFIDPALWKNTVRAHTSGDCLPCRGSTTTPFVELFSSTPLF
ncbi:hypothetical protein Anapl_01188 [Anas platyrhynchos]|uniref:Uncharacterized protein n=1 Tax=Anas platyrhynchos TaxID=8839 RepID=R0K6S2_ANAPL|nr:hypothetical protein Anapl_01188 [Anas platyrhynchos]